MATHPYDRVTFHGKPTDRRTAVMARRVEKTLGITFICWQGSYNTSVDASAGTHSGGGALDLNVPGDPERIVRHLRRSGFAAWHRTEADGFSEHIHCIDIGNKLLASEARIQVTDYREGGNGLYPYIGGDDRQKFRPQGDEFYSCVDHEGFSWADWKASLSLRQKIGNLTDRIRELFRARKQAKRRLDKLS
jgi:hypothetical protein